MGHATITATSTLYQGSWPSTKSTSGKRLRHYWAKARKFCREDLEEAILDYTERPHQNALMRDRCTFSQEFAQDVLDRPNLSQPNSCAEEARKDKSSRKAERAARRQTKKAKSVADAKARMDEPAREPCHMCGGNYWNAQCTADEKTREAFKAAKKAKSGRGARWFSAASGLGVLLM